MKRNLLEILYIIRTVMYIVCILIELRTHLSMIIDLQCISISHQGDPFVGASTTRPPKPYQKKFNYPQDIILIALLRVPNPPTY